MDGRIRGSDDRVATYAPFYREFLTTRNVLIVAFCIISLLVGCIVLLSTMTATPGLFTPSSVGIFFVVTLLLNGSIGVIVSLLISSIILRDQRFEVQLDLDRRIAALADNVFAGVLAVEHDPAYVRLVRKRVLAADFTRQDMAIRIELQPVGAVEGDPRNRRFTKLATQVRYVQRNIAVEARGAQFRVLVPNPVTPAVKRLVKLTYARVGGEALAPDAIRALNEIAQQQLVDNSLVDAEFALGERTLSPGEELEVEFHYDIVKEEEDNELILTAMPARSITLSVRDSTGRSLIMLAKSIHSSPIYPSNSAIVMNGWAEWKLNDWAFPRQGLLFWWKLPAPGRPDGGLDGAPGDAISHGDGDTVRDELPRQKIGVRLLERIFTRG